MVFRRYHSPVNLSTRERQLITTLVVLLIVLAIFQILADLTEVLSRVADVVVIYIGIAFVLAGTLALAVPGLVSQLNDLIVRAPEYGDRAAREVVELQQ